MAAYLILDSWAGRQRVACEILAETPKRYRVRLLADALLPGGRHRAAGDVVLVPRYAVKQDDAGRGRACPFCSASPVVFVGAIASIADECWHCPACDTTFGTPTNDSGASDDGKS